MFLSDYSALTHASNQQVLVQCDFCGNTILKRYADAIRQPHHFCNRNCGHKYQRKIALEKLNDRVGGSFKDWLYSKYIIEMLPTSVIAKEIGFTGHQAVINWLRVFDIPVRTLSECRTGVLSPNYNPNLTDKERIRRRDTKEDYHFKYTVFERDNFTCQKCGKHGGTLNAHHILNFNDNPDKRYDISNGITLCDSCHILFHRTYGYRNNTVEQLLNFLE
jgi:ribosomal protein L37AE/L43A